MTPIHDAAERHPSTGACTGCSALGDWHGDDCPFRVRSVSA